jgi:hypothetical protein
MPGNYPEESIQHSEHGKSLKSRSIFFNFIHFCNVEVAVHIVLVPTTCRNLKDTSTNQSCIEILNIFCERMAGYLTFISVISNFDSWNSLFRFSSFRTYVTLRCLIQVIPIEMVVVITESVISDAYHICLCNLRTFFSILATEKSGCVKYADFFCGGLDLGFILV